MEAAAEGHAVALVCAALREPLTERERETIALMAEGRSNRAIAARLFLSDKIVESHVRSIFRKLGLDDRPDDHRRVLAVIAYLRP